MSVSSSDHPRETEARAPASRLARVIRRLGRFLDRALHAAPRHHLVP